MLAPTNKLVSRQATPTEALLQDVSHILQYAASHPNASMVFHASDMWLVVSSDASYLSETKAGSYVGGHQNLTKSGDRNTTPLNGAIDVISVTLPAVVSSAAEAELAGTFTNAQYAVATRSKLETHSIRYCWQHNPSKTV